MTTSGPPQTFMVRLSDGREFGPAPIELVARWAREGRVPIDALLAATDGSGAIRSVLSDPTLRSILEPAMTPPTQQGAVGKPDSSVSVMIPYKNGPALIGYYLSIVALIPLVGAVAGPIAIGLGIAGLRKRLRQPEVHGLVHAWIAIIVGAIGTLISAGCVFSGFMNLRNW